MRLQTPLHSIHAALGATFTDFAGYDMPVHYGSIKQEHAAVREEVGIFDVSHMGNLWITGGGEALARCTPSDPAKLADGRCKYTVLLRDDGTILDDTIYSRYGDRLHLIPNAGMADPVAEHLRRHGAEVQDTTQDVAILAVQGPKAPAVLEAMDLAIKPFHIRKASWQGVELGVSGTGYTGEKGAELLVPAEDAGKVWEGVLAAGATHGIRPVGLGARDTLRLEKGFALAGNEFAGGRTPVEAGLGWLIDWDVDFLGRDRIQAQKQSGDHDRLLGLLQEKGVPRAGYDVYRGDDPVGTVTSGTQSPTLGAGIALAYLRGVGKGDTVEVDVRGRRRTAQVVRPPFV